MRDTILIPNNMTMAEIERHCETKAKRREAITLKLKIDLDKNQKMMEKALKELDKNLNL